MDMYGIVTYVYLTLFCFNGFNHVGKYTIHGSYGIYEYQLI